MGTTRGWPPALKGETNPSFCSAVDSPVSINVKLGADADPESLTVRVPVAVTSAFGFRTPLSFRTPLLRVMVSVVLFVEGTSMLTALGLATVEPAGNDHRRW
jgi:hypothetical protein